MPGSRNSRHPDEKFYERFGVRVIVPDGPGYGASTRLAGRGISMVADDAAELLDHLGLDAVSVSGGSAGGPHALAFATLAVLAPWDFDPSDVGCSLTWWHGEHDRNTPISAVRRLVAI